MTNNDTMLFNFLYLVITKLVELEEIVEISYNKLDWIKDVVNEVKNWSVTTLKGMSFNKDSLNNSNGV